MFNIVGRAKPACSRYTNNNVRLVKRLTPRRTLSDRSQHNYVTTKELGAHVTAYKYVTHLCILRVSQHI